MENKKSEEESGNSDSKNTAAIGKKNVWKTAAVGLGSGILLGSSASLLSASAPVDHIDDDNSGGEEGENEPHPEWTDGEVPVATSVSDDMSFSEAFAAARTEVGSGGAFEWRGNIYGTFTADEWNGMTAEQKEEYGNHFNWNKVNSLTETASSSHISSDSQSVHTSDEVEVVSTDNVQTNQGNEATADEVEISSVAQTSSSEDVAIVEVEHEVEVLGVIHDEESGTNIGGLVVDGQEVVLVDVDDDGVFDVIGADVDGDHQITQNELADISGQNITVNDLGGVSNPDNPLYASNDNEIDYTNETDYGA